MRDKNDKLTSQIKHKLQNYEVPAGDDLWARIENDLPDVKAAGRFRRYLYVGLAAAAVWWELSDSVSFLLTNRQFLSFRRCRGWPTILRYRRQKPLSTNQSACLHRISVSMCENGIAKRWQWQGILKKQLCL